MPLPHLDRPFDYAIPDEWASEVVPGCRVKVRFAGRQRDGYVLVKSLFDAEETAILRAAITTCPGVAALDVIDNVIPYIPKEEEKVEQETRKILGVLSGEEVQPLALPLSCTCTRVPVLEGHTEAVFCETERPAPVEEVKAALRAFVLAVSLR